MGRIQARVSVKERKCIQRGGAQVFQTQWISGVFGRGRRPRAESPKLASKCGYACSPLGVFLRAPPPQSFVPGPELPRCMWSRVSIGRLGALGFGQVGKDWSSYLEASVSNPGLPRQARLGKTTGHRAQALPESLFWLLGLQAPVSAQTPGTRGNSPI